MAKKINYPVVLGIAICLAIVFLGNLFFFRIDLSSERRYSLTPATKTLLAKIDSTITIRVFLTGDLPADYKKLSVATQDLLAEFSSLSSRHLQIVFEKPAEGIEDETEKNKIYDSLSKLGVVFEQTEMISNAGDKQTSQLVTPAALVNYREGQKPIAIDLRSSRKIFKPYNVINESQGQEDVDATRNAAEALLEFKFADAIDKLTRTYIPTIAYAVGNGEPTNLTVNDLGESLRNEYRLAVFDLKKGYPDPSQIDAMIVVKPTETFTEEDQLKLDQYLMNGGKIIWFIDKLHAELDSLMRSKAEYTAFDRGLGLDELLFKYGVRINADLLQDLNCSKMPIVIGTNPDGSPRMQRVPWPYYPFLSARSDNPISKNLERVLPIFPSSIDTVKAVGVKKTLLLATDTNSRRINSPAMVSVNSVKGEADLMSFQQSYVPVAVLLEGNFSSLFANRLPKLVLDSLQRHTGKPFAANSKATKQIVVADGDLVTNAISSTNGPLAMGMLPLENYRFANREFFLNSLDYLVSNSQLFESRNKDFVLRLLDKQKLATAKTDWQLINLALPLLLVILIGILLQWLRKRKYQG